MQTIEKMRSDIKELESDVENLILDIGFDSRPGFKFSYKGNDNMNKTSELALVECLPVNVLPHTRQGRLQNKLKALQLAVHREFDKMPLITKEEKEIASDKITAFGLKTGWDKTEKHPVTLISFLLEMIENSKYKYSYKITKLLVEIFEYYERGKEARTACLVAGKGGHQKWMS